MRGWIDPGPRYLAAAIHLALTRPTRIVTHAPFKEDNPGHFTAETGRAARSRRRPQQLGIPECYDHKLGR